MTQHVREWNVEVVVGMESRGFIFAAPIAYNLGVGFVPVRKLGKLPADTISAEYALEYGTNTLELHVDAIGDGQRVLVVDDLLATGGTVGATIDLRRAAGRRGGRDGVPGRAHLPRRPTAARRLPGLDDDQLLRRITLGAVRRCCLGDASNVASTDRVGNRLDLIG